MHPQVFEVGDQPRIMITGAAGSVSVRGHNERTVMLETDDDHLRMQHSSDGLLLANPRDDIELLVPHNATLVVERVAGDFEIFSVREVDVREISGDAELAEIAISVRLRNISGSLEIDGAGDVQIEGQAQGDANLRNVASATIERIDGDLTVERSNRITIGAVGGDCSLEEIAEAVTFGSVGGDFTLENSPAAVATGGSVGGDCEIEAASFEFGDIGGDAECEARASIRIGTVGGDCEATSEQGPLVIGNIGGDAELRATAGSVRVGNVGGDLELTAQFGAESSGQINVGGDATLELPELANVTVRATVGGEVHSKRATSSQGGFVTLVYGEGAGALNMLVGGDLFLDGSKPRTASTNWSDWGAFGRDLGILGADLGRELGQIGADLGRDLGQAFGSPNNRWVEKANERASKISSRIQEKLRAAEAEARRSNERASRDHERSRSQGERVTVRMGNREWRFDQERLDRLKRQAYEAAQSGVSSAVEAVDRALAGMGVPPAPPAPPAAPAAPAAPAPPAEPAAPVSPAMPATGVTMRMEQPTAAPRDIEAERGAILRMIAEGRLSPEEGDMLLEALG